MFFRSFWIYVCLHITTPAFADAAVAGSIEANVGGKQIVLASLRSDYDIKVLGDVVNVKLTQTFENPYEMGLNAKYLFPLNKQAAVHAMTMYVGDEVISAEIAEIKQAKKKFAQAKHQGKAAALLQQHRPNMFTQRIANLMPGQPIKVVLEYTHLVPKVDGAYELVVPMVVGPRFQPAGAGVAPVDSPTGVAPVSGESLWKLEALPNYPVTAGVHIPKAVVADRVSMSLALEAPLAIQASYSETHKLNVRDVSSSLQDMTFADGLVRDNKDFVLRYTLAGSQVDAGLLSHWQVDEGGYFSLLIEPPEALDDTRAVAREMVFLLDCSGSMNGQPMAASKRFMRHALKNLRSQDSFRIIRFSDAATSFSQHALPATPSNIARGIQYTDQLYGGGGTMMASGIRQALGAQALPDAIRNVVFLTDGYIGNEASILKLVHELRGSARLVAFGVGSGVNRYLLDELGRVGRGFTRYYDPTKDDESLEATAVSLATRLQTPVLTDVAIDWGGLPVTDLKPSLLPDLYVGDSIRVSGRFTKPATGTIRVSGEGRGHKAELSRKVDLGEGAGRSTVRRVWARQAVADLMHAYTTPVELREDKMTNKQLQAGVTDLGLLYGIATRWTAFVAVSRKIYNPNPAQNGEADVALAKVAGVSSKAYSAKAMTGYAAPEPGIWLALLMAMAVLGWRFKFGRRDEQCH